MIARSQSAGMVTYQRRPRSLWGNLTLVLLQPITFFSAFPATRQWLWVAAIVLVLTGFSAVNQPSAAPASSADTSQMMVPPSDVGIPTGPDAGFIPPNIGGGAADNASAPDVRGTVMTALLAAGGVILTWFIQALLLCEVSLINGRRPSFSANLRVAVWASVPLALMLLIQQIYFAAGGSAGQMGVSLLLDHWAGFQTLPAFSQVVLTTLATNFTLFWLWGLALIYFGGRYVLNGRRTAVMLVVLAWVIISVLLPALIPDGKATASTQGADTPMMQQVMPENAPLQSEGGSSEGGGGSSSEGQAVPVRPLKG